MSVPTDSGDKPLDWVLHANGFVNLPVGWGSLMWEPILEFGALLEEHLSDQSHMYRRTDTKVA